MIRFIEPAQRAAERAVLEQFFRLRKKIFCDQLKWVEATPDGMERDAFDDLYNVYIIDVTEDDKRVKGGVRLMPTTGPTLLHTVWPDMLPDPDDFRAPTIWEATRFCVDEAAAETRKGTFLNLVTLSVALAAMDFAATRGITHLIGICDSKFLDMAAAFGEEAEILSQRVDANGNRIGCALWPTNRDRSPFAWALDPIVRSRKAAIGEAGIGRAGSAR